VAMMILLPFSVGLVLILAIQLCRHFLYESVYLRGIEQKKYFFGPLRSDCAL